GTAGIDTGATEVVPLDERHLTSCLGQGGGEPSASLTGPDDNRIIGGGVWHDIVPLLLSRIARRLLQRLMPLTLRRYSVALQASAASRVPARPRQCGHGGNTPGWSLAPPCGHWRTACAATSNLQRGDAGAASAPLILGQRALLHETCQCARCRTVAGGQAWAQ